MSKALTPSRDIARLLDIMAALRTPGTGCPWDLEQSFTTIAPYTIEEAYEVADAIQRGDMDDLADELGDLLLQVVFHARMAEEIGAFDFSTVVEAITAKLIRRHPHVFNESGMMPADDVKIAWERIKANEKTHRAAKRHGSSSSSSTPSALEGVPIALPALTRAIKLQQRASRSGFDWNDIRTVLAKVREEADEIEVVLDTGAEPQALAEEIGDLLFTVANLARHACVDGEHALRRANAKFERRFRFIENALASKDMKGQAKLQEMDALWTQAKREGL